MSTYNLCFEQRYEKYQNFLSEKFYLLVVKFSAYLNRHVFVLTTDGLVKTHCISKLARLSFQSNLFPFLKNNLDEMQLLFSLENQTLPPKNEIFQIKILIIFIPVSILRKSISGRHRPVRVADGPMTVRCRFTKNARWDSSAQNIDLAPTIYVFEQK